ncbi:hypothetical protein [Streptomyces sp. NPDC126522]|uniref:hypothetical protein n=1 Tax=Streptomyces sp. NPDC126522 TaxID=3155211 RepID=UPI00331C09FD
MKANQAATFPSPAAYELAQSARDLTTGSLAAGFEVERPRPTWTETVDTVEANFCGNYPITGLYCALTVYQVAARTC